MVAFGDMKTVRHCSCPQGINERRQRLTGQPDKAGCTMCSKRDTRKLSREVEGKKRLHFTINMREGYMQRAGLGILLQDLVGKSEEDLRDRQE